MTCKCATALFLLSIESYTTHCLAAHTSRIITRQPFALQSRMWVEKYMMKYNKNKLMLTVQ